ncbi:MAG: hypothetical protein V1773_17910 [bacterium]
MKFLFILFVTIITLLPQKSFSQTETNDFSIKFGGYVNLQAIYDSRQVVAVREGHFLLYPKAVVLNSKGEDINKIDNFQMAAIQTRVSAKVTGGTFLGAKTSGLVEVEFMGNSDADVNGLRIRHAFVDFKWSAVSLLVGQYWNPLFVPESFPDQIGSNGGAPFQPFARNPQIRLSYQLGNLKTIVAAAAERDYVSIGPKGSSNEYLKNSKIPALYLQFQLKENEHLFGLSGEYKSLLPTAVTSKNFISTNKINSYAIAGFSKFVFKPFVIKLEGVYGTNLANYTMLGGYAVKQIDTVTQIENYTPIKTFSAWIDLIFGNELEFAVFAGYTKNLGSDDKIVGNYYSRGSDIDNVFRVAPRIQYKEGNVKLAFEVEYTSAAYGKKDLYGKVSNTTNAENIRVYTSVFYFLNF